jgi:hypothetical protein
MLHTDYKSARAYGKKNHIPQKTYVPPYVPMCLCGEKVKPVKKKFLMSYHLRI